MYPLALPDAITAQFMPYPRIKSSDRFVTFRITKVIQPASQFDVQCSDDMPELYTSIATGDGLYFLFYAFYTLF